MFRDFSEQPAADRGSAQSSRRQLPASEPVANATMAAASGTSQSATTQHLLVEQVHCGTAMQCRSRSASEAGDSGDERHGACTASDGSQRGGSETNSGDEMPLTGMLGDSDCGRQTLFDAEYEYVTILGGIRPRLLGHLDRSATVSDAGTGDAGAGSERAASESSAANRQDR